MRKNITENERLQLIGLVTLARQHYKVVDQARDAISALIEEDDSLLHDATWEYDMNLDKAIHDMGVEVTDAAS